MAQLLCVGMTIPASLGVLRVIYEFGLTKVEHWRSKTEDADHPGKLFSQHVKEARALKAGRAV